jgi:hypothetical protein
MDRAGRCYPFPLVVPNGVRTRVSTLRGWLERPGQGIGIKSDLRKQSRQVPMITGHFGLLLGPFLAQPSGGYRRRTRDDILE